MSAAVPAGWSATSARTASTAPAGLVSGNLTVTSAASAPAAFYPITVAAANTSAMAVSGSVGGTIAIAAAPPASTFTGTTTTDKAVYTLPSKGSVKANITTTVLNGGTPVQSAVVSFRVTDPAGAVTTFSGTSDRNGKAKATYDIKVSARKGSYQVTSTATKGALTSTSTTSFVVQ